jgi:hypothetical protein
VHTPLPTSTQPTKPNIQSSEKDEQGLDWFDRMKRDVRLERSKMPNGREVYNWIYTTKHVSDHHISDNERLRVEQRSPVKRVILESIIAQWSFFKERGVNSPALFFFFTKNIYLMKNYNLKNYIFLI